MMQKRRVGTPEILEAWRKGEREYQPVFGRMKLKPEGTPGASLMNLRKLLRSGSRQVCCMHVGPGGVLVVFKSKGPEKCYPGYLAAGFEVGTEGEAGTALAKFASQCGFGDAEAIYRYVAALPATFRGQLLFPDVATGMPVEAECFYS